VHVNDVTVTAVEKIIKNSNHSYVCKVLHVKLVQLQLIWESVSSRMSFQIRQNLAPTGLENIRYSPNFLLLLSCKITIRLCQLEIVFWWTINPPVQAGLHGPRNIHKLTELNWTKLVSCQSLTFLNSRTDEKAKPDIKD